MADDLFEGLPPPSSANPLPSCEPQELPKEPKPKPKFASFGTDSSSSQAPQPALKSALKKPKEPSEPNPVLKSALKRPKEPSEPNPEATVPGKKLRFKTTTDASEKQVIEAMQKIASHIKNPTKFGKASKLAIQLIQAGSVKAETSDYFFSILEAAMTSSTSCTDPSIRADIHALFSAAQDASECLNKKQKNQLTTWTIRAVMANDLLTDDSFLFSKTAGQLKEEISNLPVATEDDDREEAAALEVETKTTDEDDLMKKDMTSDVPDEENNEKESDPFGLDAFLTQSSMKKGDKVKGNKDVTPKVKEEEETKRFLKSQREALVLCLEIAARRYKTPWCQTVIDILAKHAFDNIRRFTSEQRNAIGKLWASIREQHNRRKQGKTVTGKLDVNGFEWLQQKYANEKISIRHSVGGSGDRKTEMWLG
ncbi:hypothetical protein RchiOBHm_Chr3g0450061 [Rosa chinensis]|uniref:Nucleolar/coiled-body phosphoprotein n=1 Tax=Rosa chinensis TaxID=74649 RepID=A0A2P6R5N6_ROSCH|nr:uncharacterized protein LOC112191268 [Rosa chinensis]PRQ41740.1 hypothetical protein RchiOBHm_Chr3g0450061 [Rosa chinensis]